MKQCENLVVFRRSAGVWGLGCSPLLASWLWSACSSSIGLYRYCSPFGTAPKAINVAKFSFDHFFACCHCTVLSVGQRRRNGWISASITFALDYFREPATFITVLCGDEKKKHLNETNLSERLTCSNHKDSVSGNIMQMLTPAAWRTRRVGV